MIRVHRHIDLSRKNSLRIGGSARCFVSVHSESELVEALCWAGENGVVAMALGRGTNICISDSGWPGLIIDTTGMRSLHWRDSEVICEAGALLHTFVLEAAGRGLAGIEDLAGIPGTIGGGLIMNAGAFRHTISDRLLYAEGIDMETGEHWRRMRDDLSFGYRKSALQNGRHIVTRAAFGLDRAGPDTATRITDILKRRAQKQPLDQPNCGSVFKRPRGDYAGRLIEKNGCKGLRSGGAMVSPKHANFIVNTGTAAAEDVRGLIATVQRKVYEADRILLEPEVLFVGEFKNDLFAPEPSFG
jgi:UDP-N-acetylmuramate dehydrogenase